MNMFSGCIEVCKTVSKNSYHSLMTEDLVVNSDDDLGPVHTLGPV